MKWRLIHYLETAKHKAWVALYLFRTCLVLLRRAVRHDCSKFSQAEGQYFTDSLPKLRGLEYGSQDYEEAIAELGPALTHHYRHNSHHPEFYPNGIRDMTPLDILEMLCDWKAAARRHATGNYGKSLELNMKRFHYSENFLQVLWRTSREIGLISDGN